MNKENLNEIFGNGRLWGDDESFFKLSHDEQAEILGAQEACPVVERLIKPVSQNGRGAEVMRGRYGAIIIRLDMVRNLLIQADKPDLAAELYTPIPRKDGEPIGKHDQASVPQTAMNFIFRSPMAYALPRIMYDFEQLGYSGKKIDGFIYASENALLASSFFEKAIKECESDTLMEITAIYVEKVMSHCLTQKEDEAVGMMLRHLIGKGKLEEENCYELYRQIFQSLRRYAPRTMNFYYSLSDEQKDKFGLVIEQVLGTI